MSRQPAGERQVRIFVINLDEDGDRLRRFTRVMEFYGAPFERWPATRGSDLDHTQFGVRPLAPGIFVKDFDEWSRNEAACGVSHIRLLQHIVAEEIPWAAVFEDDAIVRRTPPPLIEDWLLPADAEIVMLGQRAVTDEPPEYLDVPVYGPVKGGAGTEGYLISQEGAQKLLKILLPLLNPLDFQLQVGAVGTRLARLLATGPQSGSLRPCAQLVPHHPQPRRAHRRFFGHWQQPSPAGSFLLPGPPGSRIW